MIQDLIVRDASRQESLLAEASHHATPRLPVLTLTERQLCDLELLLNGGFSPLTGFMNEQDYSNCLHSMRLSNGTLWPIPIVLDVSEEQVKHLDLKRGQRLVLLDPRDEQALAILSIQDLYKPDKMREACLVYGDNDVAHPGVTYLHEQTKDIYLGGPVDAIQLPTHYDYASLRLTPTETRALFKKWHWTRIVAFQTRNPMHRAHRELTVRAARAVQANILIHPVVGLTKPGDVDHYTRVKVYKALMPMYPDGLATLSLLPLAMRMAGPREAVWHALIRRNYGCTHFIVGRDHAGPGPNSKGVDFYGPYEAQHLVEKFKDEIGIQVVPFQMVSYCPDLDAYLPADQIPEGVKTLNISGTELRRRLKTGAPIPSWFSYPEVVRVLRAAYPPRPIQGFTVFLTGLYQSGHCAIARALYTRLCHVTHRTVTLLDSDTLRHTVSSDLGYSQQARCQNLERASFVASALTRTGGACICALIAPYEKARQQARQVMEEAGGFLLVYIKTPLQVCLEIDRTGTYEKAKRGEIKNFTGIDDPYEPPKDAHLELDLSHTTVSQSVHEIVLWLEKEGYLGSFETL